MKRFFVLALTLVVMLSIAACGNNDNTSSNNSSASINVATPTEKSSFSSPTGSYSTPTSVLTKTYSATQDIQGTGMNLTQIQTGNYSSLLGTWTGVAYAGNPHDGTGLQWKAGARYTLSVSSDKIVYSNGNLVIQGNTLKDSAGLHTLKFENNGGSLDASLTDQNVAIDWAVYFYPKGAKNILEPNNGVKIDNTKNLIVIWTSNNGFTEVFEQSDPSNSITNSSSKTTASTNVLVK